MTVQDLFCCLRYRVIMIIRIEAYFPVDRSSARGPIKGHKYLNKPETEGCKIVIIVSSFIVGIKNYSTCLQIL